MSTTLGDALAKLQTMPRTSYWADRALGQLDYAGELSRLADNAYLAPLTHVANDLLKHQELDGAIGQTACLAAEQAMADLAKAAKAYRLICVGHAHIDMNWMWSWQETVAITIETFRTMLDLLAEFPGFTFGQSQASVYRLIEDLAPEMLPDIQRHVQSGRWEVTASHWVEADKNMTDAESMVRHLLYTRRYLTELLQLSPDQLNIDFEPDTFGHSLHVPEILAQGGVHYYYHCRGADDHDIYRWSAPSGRSIIAYREPLWYNASFETRWAKFVPEFCQRNGLDTFLKVYGVGDHGGGPTRRDLNRILDMGTWPIFPQVDFGTYREWFALLESKAETWPEVHGERNFIFSGCYTSQSRIKAGNRHGEVALYKAELANAVANSLTGLPYPQAQFQRGWQHLLFNQFHDILPGSGIVDTREHAMGLYQDLQGIATARQTLAYRAIANAIDTSAFGLAAEQPADSIAQGAGVGFGVSRQAISQTGRAAGSARLFTIFNPVADAHHDLVELTVWEWEGPRDHLKATDEQGRDIPCQVIQEGTNHYWGHRYLRVLISISLPSSGYTTIKLSNQPPPIPQENPFDHEVALRLDTPASHVLESDYLRCVFNPVTLAIDSLIDKASGQQLISPAAGPAQFRFVHEDTARGMTAWRIGRYREIQTAHQNTTLKSLHQGPNLLRQSLSVEASFGHSMLKITYALSSTSAALDIDVECDWHEVGKPASGIPQLQFHAPLPYQANRYYYDAPLGIVQRAPMPDDAPALSWILGRQEGPNARSLRLISDSTNGFRGDACTLTATLLRSSYDPDPYPEYGIHRLRLRLDAVHNHAPAHLLNSARAWCVRPEVLAITPHTGTLPPTCSLFQLESESVILQSVKSSEDGTGALIVRLVETAGADTQFTLTVGVPIQSATCVDLHEAPLDCAPIVIHERDLRATVKASSLVTLRLELAR